MLNMLAVGSELVTAINCAPFAVVWIFSIVLLLLPVFIRQR